jgi:hypothetical protein
MTSQRNLSFILLIAMFTIFILYPEGLINWFYNNTPVNNITEKLIKITISYNNLIEKIGLDNFFNKLHDFFNFIKNL